MTFSVEQILALSDAGFTAEQITAFAGAVGDPQPAPAADPQPAPAADPEPAGAPAPDPSGAPEDDTPAWFGKFLQRYNEDISNLSKGVKARNVRHAGGDPGPSVKTPEQLMAEAYANIK